jgi:UDP-N-acetylglucosamine:LPS N-acetylglucosamine transferase
VRSTRVLLISAAIGGGHDAVSSALAQHLEERGAIVAIDDFYDAQVPRLSHLVSRLNRVWLLHFGRAYQWVWDHLVRRGAFAALAARFFRITGWVALRRLVKRHQPDVIVATYPMCVPALAALRRRGRLGARVISYPNDFHAHVLWVAEGVDLYLAPTYEAKAWLQSYGVRAPVHVVGIPVRSAFVAIPEKALARRSLGLVSERPVVLAQAGGDGVGHLDEVVQALEDLPVEVAVICGRNERLRGRVQELGSHSRVVGFVEDMELWLAAADVLVGTPGPISSSEAFCAGTPVVTYRPYTGHGIENARWVAQSGGGWVVQEKKELHDLVARLITEPELMSAASRTARLLARPHAAEEAAERVLSLYAAEAASPPRRRRHRPLVAAAAAAAALVVAAGLALEVPAVAASTLHVGVVRHVGGSGREVGVMVEGPADPQSADELVSLATGRGVSITYLTSCGVPDSALLRDLAGRGVDVGVVGDGRLLSTPGAVGRALGACRAAIRGAGATASAFIPHGERYSWGAYVGSRGWRRMSPAQVVDLQVGGATVPAATSPGDVILFRLSSGPQSLRSFAGALAEMDRRRLVPVSVTELLSSQR